MLEHHRLPMVEHPEDIPRPGKLGEDYLLRAMNVSSIDCTTRSIVLQSMPKTRVNCCSGVVTIGSLSSVKIKRTSAPFSMFDVLFEDPFFDPFRRVACPPVNRQP